MTESSKNDRTKEARIRSIMKAFGCDRSEALFIIALQDGEVDGDIIEVTAEELKQEQRKTPDK